MTDVQLLIGLLGLFLAAVFLAGAEAALLRVPSVRVAVLVDEGDHGARRVQRLIDDLPRVMNTVLLTVLLVQIGAATLSGVFAERHFGGVGITVTSIVLTVVLFVYAEAIPKTYAVRHPLQVARFVAMPLMWLTAGLRPVVSLLIWFADLQAPGTGIATGVEVTEAELRKLAFDAAKSGEIEAAEAAMVDRVFEVGDALVDEILVPRIDIVSIDRSASIEVALEAVLASGHRRLPVTDGDIDHITGVVRLRDIAEAVAAGRSASVNDLARPVLVVPESKRIIGLLREMQDAGIHFAVVVDEHGGTSGIVTIEDVVAELVGEVADEGEPRRDLIVDKGGKLVVDASADVDALEGVLAVELPEGAFRTVGGLVIDAAGYIPTVGEVVEVAGHEFRVIRASSRRLRTIEVEPIERGPG